MAGSAFKDAAVVKAMQHFTPILVDGDSEKAVCGEYGAKGFPTMVFADVKGKAVAKVVGAVPTPKFLSEVEAAAKKAKKGKPSKAYKALLKATGDLEKALGTGNVKAALAATEAAADSDLTHPLVDAARAAREKLLADGKQALLAARAQRGAGELDAARTALRKLSLDYKGTEVGKEAAKELKEVKAELEK